MKQAVVLFFLLLFSCGPKNENKDYSWLDPSKFDAKTDIQKGDIHLISYGLRYPLPKGDSLTKAYGFYFQERGCGVTDTEVTLEKIYNDEVIRYLEKRNGKGWYERFCFVYDSLDKIMWDKLNDTTKKM